MAIHIRKESAGSAEDKKEWEMVFRGNLIGIEKHVTKGYERAVRPPGVRLILRNDAGKILITKEFRKEHGKYDYRLPGGKVFDDFESYLAVRNDPDGMHLAVMRAAQLEGKQEAGVDEIRELSMVSRSVAGASVEWDLYYLTGTVGKLGSQELDGDENEQGIEVGFYSRAQVLRMLRSRDISEDRTAGVLYRWLSESENETARPL